MNRMGLRSFVSFIVQCEVGMNDGWFEDVQNLYLDVQIILEYCATQVYNEFVVSRWVRNYVVVDILRACGRGRERAERHGCPSGLVFKASFTQAFNKNTDNSHKILIEMWGNFFEL